MAFIAGISGVVWTMGTTIATTTSTTTAIIAKDFFLDFLFNPLDHLVPLLFFAVLFIAASGGTLFLVKKAYDRYCTG